MRYSLKYLCFVALCHLLWTESVLSTDETTTSAASQFKVGTDTTSPALLDHYKAEDEALWTFVEQHVPAVLDHTGTSAFDKHLKGVQSVLRFWKAPDHLTKAGLFHSIYGTEGFQGFSLPLSERPAIQSLIGTKAEQLCFIFCMVDRSTVDQTVLDWSPQVPLNATYTFYARPELGRFPLQLSKDEWLDFLELTLADWLEQVEGAASKASSIFLWKTGEAYAYRRRAYAQMSHILSYERAPRLETVAPRMLQAVMDTEARETRHLVQPRTPPMSAAAADALAALRAVGEDIPLNLAPQPEEEECSLS